MTETSTGATEERRTAGLSPEERAELVKAERELSAVILRVVADLYAAYGRGVTMDMSALPQVTFTNVTLGADSGRAGVAATFFDDGEVIVCESGCQGLSTGRVEALAVLRAFIIRHGQGAR